MRKIYKLLLVTITVILSFNVFSQTKITVFAAASLTNALETISKAYNQTHPDTDIVFSFASSSVLARQIEQGAPADIFISADQKWMDYLIERNLAKDKITLLQNSLVLIVPKESKLNDVTINRDTNWATILPKNEKIAVGDPDHVPAGLYAKKSLTYLDAYKKLEPQMARASNVRDALMLVEREEAVAGIVYSTDAKVSNKVKIVGTFPADSFKAIEYPMTLLNSQGAAFYTYLQTDAAKAIFQQYGFVTQ